MIKYIKNYIEVQRYRLEKGTSIHISIPEHIPDIKIVPFIFLPLVENTFKHVSHLDNPSQNFIYVDININKDNLLNITTKNTFSITDAVITNSTNHIGVGIDNLKKRLDLSYPYRYKFDSYVKNNLFCNVLTLKL